MKRMKVFLFCIILAALCSLALAASAEVIQGDCTLPGAWGGGSTLTYTLDTSTGVLTINGTGGWEDYSSDTPWGWTMSYPSFGSGDDYREYVKTIIVSDGITEIASHAFGGCKNATSVSIPASVTRIGNSAFNDCASLKSVTIPGSNLKTIEKDAFSNCTSLVSVTMPSTVTAIGEDAFWGCTSLGPITAYGSVGGGAFYNCGATSITVSNCTGVGNAAFKNCEHLTTVKISGACGTLGKEAFENCSVLQSVTLPDSITEIQEDAFYQCEMLESIKLPASLVRLGNSAFRKTGLKSIEMPDSVTDLEDQVFCGCKTMVSAKVSDQITNLPYRTFYDCYQLKDVNIPSHLEKIGQDCFAHCDSIVSVELPSTVTEIGPYAFLSMDSLKYLKVYGNIDYQAIIENEALETLYVYNCGSIGSSAFDGNKACKVIRIEGTVSVIPESAFCDCKGMVAVSLPASVKTIAKDAFRRCESLRAFYTPLSAGEITVDESGNGWLLETAVWHCGETIPANDNDVDKWTCSYTWSADNTKVTAVAVCGNKGDHVINDSAETESEITEKPGCETVGKRLYTTKDFKYHMFTEQQKTVDEPALGHDWRSPDYDWADDFSSVTAKHTCRRADHEETETVKPTYKVKTKPTFTEEGVGVYTATFTKDGFTTQTREVKIPVLAPKITSGGLKYSLDLKAGTATVTGPVKKTIAKVTIPATVKDQFGKSYKVTAVKASAFKGCAKMKKLTIGKNVKTIGQKAFYGCKALAAVSGGKGITSIGAEAFRNCTALPSFILEANVSKLGAKAFYNCKKLKAFKVKTKKLTKANIGANCFNGTPSNVTFTITIKKMVKSYKAWFRKPGGAPKKAKYKYSSK